MTDAKVSSPNSMLPKQVIKAGLVFGVVAAVFEVVGVIPLIGILLGLLVWIVGITSGYAVIYTVGGTKEKLADVLKNAGLTGLIAGLVTGIGSGIASVLYTALFARVSIFGIYYTPGVGEYVSAFVGALIWGVVGMVIWNIVGGILEVYYGPEKLPASLKTNVDKLKAFLNK